MLTDLTYFRTLLLGGDAPGLAFALTGMQAAPTGFLSADRAKPKAVRRVAKAPAPRFLTKALQRGIAAALVEGTPRAAIALR